VSRKWGALILRAEIIPLNLIRIIPAEENKITLDISLKFKTLSSLLIKLMIK